MRLYTVHKIYIQHTNEEAHTPTKNLPGDAGWDLYTSREVTILGKGFQDVPTDIKIAMPEDIWARITGRSSTLRNWGCFVVEGIIDTGYRGELFIGVFNLTDSPQVVPSGTRLGQIVFHKHVGEILWSPIADLPESQRGESGFGSSGR